MRLTESGRNPHMRKAYVQQPALRLVGVEVSKAKHHACLGTPTGVSRRNRAFTHTRKGLERFAQPLRQQLVKNAWQQVLIAREPSGLYWQALSDRLQGGGDGGCLVPCQAVRHQRKPMQEGPRTTDDKAASRLFDLRRQGTCCLPVERAPALQAAYRLRPRPMAWKKRGSPLRKQLRAALPLAFPALKPLVTDLRQPTAWRCLHAHPTPASLLRPDRPRLVAQGPPRQRCGPWRPATFRRLYDLATPSLGLQAPCRIAECDITTLADDLGDALTTPRRWLDKAIALLAPRADSHLLVQLPSSGQPTAVASLTAIGDMHQYKRGNQLVKLAGRAIPWFESGSSIRKLPKSAPVGSASLRHWLYHYARRLVAPAPHFKNYSARRKRQSPGKGAAQRALRASGDKVIRLLYRILSAPVPDSPPTEQPSARYYAARRPAA